jgi:HlyD family secretion protein
MESITMRKSIVIGILIILASTILAACGSTPTVQAQATLNVPNQVTSEGVVMPVKTVELGFFPSGGVVDQVNKLPGDQVKSGDVLASLVVSPQQLAAVTAAQQELVLAQNALKDFNDTAAVSKAQANMDVALAKERVKDTYNKKRDKETAYKYSKTREAIVELDKATADYALALAQQAVAEQKAANWSNGSDQEQLAELTARVANAEKQLDSAKSAASTQLEIKAPWDGTVITNSLEPGQLGTAGTSVIQMADLTAWKVETSNLKETDVTGIAIGDAAKITMDALPGKEFPGSVIAIENIGVDKQGDITYKVTLSLPSDPVLKWNMTANVTFVK